MIRLDDLRKAGASALLALAMALAGAAAVWASTRLASDVRQAHERALAARTEAQRALAGARAEEAEIAAKIDRFRHLVERGAVGTEQRLAWVELIRDARAAPPRRRRLRVLAAAPARSADRAAGCRSARSRRQHAAHPHAAAARRSADRPARRPRIECIGRRSRARMQRHARRRRQ